MSFRVIEDILNFEVNNDLAIDIEYQNLFNELKKKREEHLPKEYYENDPVLSWDVIESLTWDLMKKKGMNWKCFVLWVESFFYSNHWKEFFFLLKVIYEVLLKKNKQNLLLPEDDEGKLSFLNYLDKVFSFAMLDIKLKEFINLNTFIKYKNSHNNKNLLQLFNYFNIDDIKFFTTIYQEGLVHFSNITNSTLSLKFNLIKTASAFETLYDLILTYNNIFNKPVNDKEEIKNEVKEELNIKEEAFLKINEALKLLEEHDKQNIAIPMLRKILKWKNSGIDEIFAEIDSPQGILGFINFLRN